MQMILPGMFFPKISVNNSGIKHIHTTENSSAKITSLAGAAAVFLQVHMSSTVTNSCGIMSLMIT